MTDEQDEAFPIKWYRTPISRDTLQSLNCRSDAKGLLQAGGYLALLLCTGMATLWCAFSGHLLLTLPLLFLHGMCSSFNINAVHELCHQTVFKSRWLNALFIRIFGRPPNRATSTVTPSRGTRDDGAMIIRTSANLAKKIHVEPVRSLPLHSNPYADWSARLFTANRAQYIVVTNTASLNDIVTHATFSLAGRGLSPLDTARMLARCPMGSLGYAFPREAFTRMSMEEQ